MIVLDTNVVSEMARPRPHPRVMDWFAGQAGSELVITVITAAELRAGVAILPEGRRRREIDAAVEGALRVEFAEALLLFDVGASRAYASILAARQAMGRPISTADAQIAAICLEHDAALATRNTKDFTGLGLTLIDPWRGLA